MNAIARSESQKSAAGDEGGTASAPAHPKSAGYSWSGLTRTVNEGFSVGEAGAKHINEWPFDGQVGRVLQLEQVSSSDSDGLIEVSGAALLAKTVPFASNRSQIIETPLDAESPQVAGGLDVLTPSVALHRNVTPSKPLGASRAEPTAQADSTANIGEIAGLDLEDSGQPPRLEDALRVISRILAAQGLVLERYRRSALLRRIRRRCEGAGVAALEAYAARLANDPEEVGELVHDILRPSGVLLRDQELVSHLRQVLPKLMAQGVGEPQFWVPDCGTGEEAYALAMMMLDLPSTSPAATNFTIYGTDSEVDAIRSARGGRFGRQPATSVPHALRQRFLSSPLASVAAEPAPDAASADFQVDPAVVGHCQFLMHTLGMPAPFVDLTAIVCRNLLTFLAPPLQRRMLERLHDALHPGGLLIVGARGEGLVHDDLFEPYSGFNGIYIRRERNRRKIVSQEAEAVRGLELYAAAFRNSGAALLLIDDTGTVIQANASAIAQFRLGSLVGLPLLDLIAAPDRRRVSAALARVASGLNESLDAETIDHRTLAFDVSAVARYPDRILVTLRGALPEVSEGTLIAARRLDSLLGAVSHGVLLVNGDGQISDMNARAERLTGWKRLEAVGQPLDQIFKVAPGEATPTPSRLITTEEPSHADAVDLHDLWLTQRDGRRLAIVANIGAADEAASVVVFEDVSERKMLVAELSYRVAHDPMTGLLNRETFESRARSAHADARRGGPSAVLCYVDVDQFKLINETLGHFAGDELLRELAAELRVLLGPRDSFARLGGDEFGVLLIGHDLRSARSVVDALILAARRFRFHWNGQGYAVTISIGASMINAESDSVTHALSAADAACFAAKDAGRDRARFAGEDEELARRYIDMSLVGKLQRALEADRFVLYFEDVVQVDHPDKVLYRELLVRMFDEDGRLTAPGAFIQAAERFFLMVSLDRWVLRNALRGIAQLPHDDIVYAVNLSAQSLSDENFLDYVIEELETSGVDPRRICFEITETAAVSRLSEAVRFIAEVSEMGCRFALDDFGAGMASFSYLKNFSVDFLKIDGSFVRSMLDNRIDHGMVESINRIGHQLGLRTIAEHVETPALLSPLSLMGVDFAQGRGLCRARPFHDLLKIPVEPC